MAENEIIKKIDENIDFHRRNLDSFNSSLKNDEVYGGLHSAVNLFLIQEEELLKMWKVIKTTYQDKSEKLSITNLPQLNKIPEEIFALTHLKQLIISNCAISILPSDIQYLVNLHVLDLSLNNIDTLPPEIGTLNKLVSLNLYGNNIYDEGLSPDLLKLTKLVNLDFRKNHLDIPIEIIEKNNSPQSILAYLKKSFETPRIPLNEVKVLFLGQGSVGKTSLVQQILYGTFDKNQPKTDGISINQWTMDNGQKPTGFLPIVNDQSSIKLNIWDFGGQEIMHATHQFFLTKRSLYLLILDARLTQEENRVEYWLKIIQSFGEASSVLIIGNKVDEHPLDIDRTGLQKKYPNIVGILETSAATGFGIEELKKEISNQVNILPHVHNLLPETWFTVKSKLEKLAKNKNFFSHDEYYDLCNSNEVLDEISKRSLIGFLHDLGVVLYFQDDPRLVNLGILNPQWVTNGVYKILNSHELFQNQGKLTLSLLNQILDLPEYPSSKRLFIVDMMKKFELCYDIEPDKSFLIPDLLPKDEPFTGEWNDALAFQIHYNVLPSSIVSRFIVRMNAFIHKTSWRAGVVLKSGNNIALIKGDTEEKKIFIWVSGDQNTRRDFLSSIRTEFKAIHNTIAKIEANEKVSLPSQFEVPPIDYEFLLRLEHDKRKTYPIQSHGKIIDIDVKQLLEGVSAPEVRQMELLISNKSDSNTTVFTPKSNNLSTISKLLLSFPKYFGRFVLDLIGRHESAESSSIILGWVLIFIIFLIICGLINPDNIIDLLFSARNFFSPLK